MNKAKKKKDAIVIPMREYLKAHKRKELADLIGNFDLGLSVKNLRKIRRQWQKS